MVLQRHLPVHVTTQATEQQALFSSMLHTCGTACTSHKPTTNLPTVYPIASMHSKAQRRQDIPHGDGEIRASISSGVGPVETSLLSRRFLDGYTALRWGARFLAFQSGIDPAKTSLLSRRFLEGTPRFVGDPIPWLSKVESALSRRRLCRAVFGPGTTAVLLLCTANKADASVVVSKAVRRSCQDIAPVRLFFWMGTPHFVGESVF